MTSPSPTAFGRRTLRLGTAWRREIDHDLRCFGRTKAAWRPILDRIEQALPAPATPSATP